MFRIDTPAANTNEMRLLFVLIRFIGSWRNFNNMKCVNFAGIVIKNVDIMSRTPLSADINHSD